MICGIILAKGRNRDHFEQRCANLQTSFRMRRLPSVATLRRRVIIGCLRENSTQKPLKNEKYPKVETWNFQALHDEMRYVEDADVCCFFLDSPKNHWEPNREATILKGQYVLKMARNFDVFSNWSPDLDPQRWCLIVGGLWRSPPKNAIAHDGCSLWGDAWVQRLVGGVCSNFDVGDGHVAWREVIHITRGRVFFWGGKGLGCSKGTCWKRGW